MAAPIRSAMVTNVRLYIQDTNTTTAPAFTDAQITTWLNTALLWWYENYEKRIKYVTLVTSWGTSPIYVKDGDAACIYPEILEVGIKVGTSDEDEPLDRMGWTELRARQTTTTGTPTHFAALKYGGAAVGAGLQNLWKFALFPVPSSGTVVLRGVVRDYPVQLSADADIVDLGDYEGKCVEIIAAILAAPRSARPELAQDLMGLLPRLVQDKLEAHMKRDEVNA
jgi:hypothetical protein